MKRDTTLLYTIKSDWCLLLVATTVIVLITLPIPLVIAAHLSKIETFIASAVLMCIWIALGFNLYSSASHRLVLSEKKVSYYTYSSEEDAYYSDIRNMDVVYKPCGKGVREYYLEITGTASVKSPIRISLHSFSSDDLSRFVETVVTHSAGVTLGELVERIRTDGVPLDIRLGRITSFSVSKIRD